MRRGRFECLEGRNAIIIPFFFNLKKKERSNSHAKTHLIHLTFQVLYAMILAHVNLEQKV